MFKKFLFCIACFLYTGTLFAEEFFKYKGLKYEIIPGTNEVIVYGTNNTIKHLNIPVTVSHRGRSYAVTYIGKSAFRFCRSLTSVTIPNSVTSIENGAFYDCTGLTSVTLPNTITSIGNRAFLDCKSLTSVTIPNSVTSIGEMAFAGCGLTSIIIPNSVINIGEGAFQHCKNLTTVTIPNSITNISKSLFFDCGLNSVILPNSITTIEDGAFAMCKSLPSITIPDGVIHIGTLSFLGCDNLTSVIFPNSVTSTGNGLFVGCKSLEKPIYNIHIFAFLPFSHEKTYQIPEGIENIAGMAFYHQSDLTSVTIPNSVKNIGKFAFLHCKGLTFIEIPNSVESVDSAFYDCDNLREVRYPRNLDISRANIPSTTKLIPYSPEPSSTTKPPPYSPVPPLLALVPNSFFFSDATANRQLDANEQSTIRFKIQNNGKGAAYNCETRVKLFGNTSGIRVETVKLPTIEAGHPYEVAIPVSSDMNIQDGKVTFSIEVYEPNGWGVAPFDLAVTTKAFEAPLLQVVDYKITSNSGNIRKMEPFTLTFNLQNTKYGDAENVKIKINIPNNVFVMDGSLELSYPIIKSGETKSIKISLAANNNYAVTDIPITISINEKYGKYAENKQLSLALDQVVPNSYHIDSKDEAPQRNEIKLATLRSDIDKNIPSSQTQNYNTLVLVITNENYQSMPQVPYAINDGYIFKEYCVKTLGIPEENILYQSNATLNVIRQKIDLLQKKAHARANARKETNIIVYYTGHGVPDINTRGAYLMPIDGYEENISTGYKLDDLYQQLGNLPAKSITVFLDACFSGVNRNDEALAQNKGARLVAKSGMPVGNMVVFAASQGNQTAFVNDKEQHGLFTYYLLKKLQDSKGDVTLDVLANYLTSEVHLKSLDLHEKEQIPSIITSPQVQNQWQNWKLK